MKFTIKHEMKGRMRVRLSQKRMTYEQADILQYYLLCNESVRLAKVYDRTCDAVINYTGDREDVIRLLQEFHYQTVEVPADVLATSGREVNAQYQEKLFNKVVFHYARKWFLPYPLNACYTSVMSLKYIWKGIKCLWARKIEVPVLDATAIGVSVARGDFSTAGSVMFLLGIGEILEEWTHKKSVDDLARTMSLNVSKVWLKTEDQEVLVPASKIKAGDRIVIRMGTVIPFDGVVTDGEATVNEASLTGESMPVAKHTESYVVGFVFGYTHCQIGIGGSRFFESGYGCGQSIYRHEVKIVLKICQTCVVGIYQNNVVIFAREQFGKMYADGSGTPYKYSHGSGFRISSSTVCLSSLVIL